MYSMLAQHGAAIQPYGQFRVTNWEESDTDMRTCKLQSEGTKVESNPDLPDVLQCQPPRHVQFSLSKVCG